MLKLIRWTAPEAEAAPLSAGYRLLRSKGSHRIYGKGTKRVVVPFHPGVVLHAKVVRQVLEAIGKAEDSVLVSLWIAMRDRTLGLKSMGRYFLNSYRPLCRNKSGREACQRFGHPPFVNAACRREPDFESPFPSITAICRGKLFAPRLYPGDRVVYMTRKGSAAKGRRHLVAVLEVQQRFGSHSAAADWYRIRSLRVPSNCLIPENPPLGIEHTDRGVPPRKDVRAWDRVYQRRVRKWPVFLVCQALRLELHTPPEIIDADLIRIFGRVPATRNPPSITEDQFWALVALFDERCGRPTRSSDHQSEL